MDDSSVREFINKEISMLSLEECFEFAVLEKRLQALRIRMQEDDRQYRPEIDMFAELLGFSDVCDTSSTISTLSNFKRFNHEEH